MYAVETVDSLKLAEMLDNAMIALNRKLNIMIQVNTSHEERKTLRDSFSLFFSLSLSLACRHMFYFLFIEEKSGVAPEQLVDLYKSIKQKCHNLHILGLMTIGSYEQSTHENETNQDFKV